MRSLTSRHGYLSFFFSVIFFLLIGAACLVVSEDDGTTPSDSLPQPEASTTTISQSTVENVDAGAGQLTVTL
jgi:hypothetical protein